MTSLPLSDFKVWTRFWNLFSIDFSRFMITFSVLSLCARLNTKPKPKQLSCTIKLNLVCVHHASGVMALLCWHTRFQMFMSHILFNFRKVFRPCWLLYSPHRSQ